jgi:sugar lactone lactonase YvrE
MRRLVPLAVLAVLAALAAAPATVHAQASSSFAQLTGSAGCIVQTFPSGAYGDVVGGVGDVCARGNGLLQAEGVAVSPDQRTVYAAASGTPDSGSNAVVTFTRDETTGALTEAGCVSDDGGDGRPGSDGLCRDGDALSGANDVAISPDGLSVYVSSGSSSGLAWFDRDPDTGQLFQQGCYKAVPRAGECKQANGLIGADGVTVSPDGRNVYVTAAKDGAVVAFARDPEFGELTPIGCVSSTGTDGLCVDGTALQGASAVAVSPDGAYVYVTAAGISAITSYARDADTGELTPAGCILDVAPEGGACTAAAGLAGAASVVLSPDGEQAYVAARSSSSVLTFGRDADTGDLTQTSCLQYAPASGEDAVYPDEEEEEPVDEEEDVDAEDAQADPVSCGDAKAIYDVNELALSADGRSLFAAGSGTLASFDRASDTGALTQTGCAQEDPEYKSCATATGLYGASGMATSSDGRSLYVASRNAHAISVFGASVAITTRATRVLGRTARVGLACPAARAGGCAGRLRLAHSARRYTLEAGAHRTYAVAVPAALRRAVRRHAARVTVRAVDGRRITRASTRRLTLHR